MTGEKRPESFEELMKRVVGQLVDAHTHLYIWEKLFFRIEEEAEVLSLYKGFVVPTINAHTVRFFIAAANVLNRGDSRAPSVYRLVQMIEEDPALAAGLDAGQLRRRLEKHESARSQVMGFRNERAAHSDPDPKTEPVRLEEATVLLQELADIVNEIQKASGGNAQDFLHWEHKDVDVLFEKLTAAYLEGLP